MVRFLHTADLQLGMRRHFLDEDAQARFMDARIEAIRAMARLAEERDCAFVGVCGDVFESNQVERRTVGRAMEAFAAIPCPVYLLPGNHDPYNAGSLYRNLELPGNVFVLRDSRPVEVRPGLEVVGAPWFSKRPLKDLVAEALGALAPGPLRICLAHGAIEGAPGAQDHPALIRRAPVDTALTEDRIHYLALGDRHSVTEIAPRIWYSGAPEATDYVEEEPGHVLVVELDERACRVERREVGRWRFRRLEFELDSLEDVESLARALDDLGDKDRTILKLTLRGTLTLRAKARLDELLERFGEVFAAIELWERHSDLAVLPDDADDVELGLVGFARTTVEKLTERAESEPAARDALALLYRLARR